MQPAANRQAAVLTSARRESRLRKWHVYWDFFFAKFEN
jgi:hypothetical protein